MDIWKTITTEFLKEKTIEQKQVQNYNKNDPVSNVLQQELESSSVNLYPAPLI